MIQRLEKNARIMNRFGYISTFISALKKTVSLIFSGTLFQILGMILQKHFPPAELVSLT